MIGEASAERTSGGCSGRTNKSNRGRKAAETQDTGMGDGKGCAQASRNDLRNFCVQWATKGQCSRGEKCGMKLDPGKKRESKGEERVPSPNLQEGFPWVKEARKVRVLQSRKNQPTCYASKKDECPKGHDFDFWHPPECPFH